MFQPAPKRCFTIESLVAKDSPVPVTRAEEPIRPAALSYANTGPMNPFLNGFHPASSRGVYPNPDLIFSDPPNPVHPVPTALAPHPLPNSPHPIFSSQQRDPSTFYPWLIHRYRYLGHRFQGESPQNFTPNFPKRKKHTNAGVKVWFQNRRTKFKRQKLEEEGSDSSQKKKGAHHINRWRIATKQASPEEIDVTSDD
uniref:Homeobox domain-containing protein n=1 Tax=Pyxicephalus adspersus TaxID=30357 RepID=A0AAV2ZQD7_PYXAD|nr:TPA: hypothetical protein GDO54_004043 [Pyxicephalus adspersus]